MGASLGSARLACESHQMTTNACPCRHTATCSSRRTRSLVPLLHVRGRHTGHSTSCLNSRTVDNVACSVRASVHVKCFTAEPFHAVAWYCHPTSFKAVSDLFCPLLAYRSARCCKPSRVFKTLMLVPNFDPPISSADHRQSLGSTSRSLSPNNWWTGMP